MDFSLTEEQQEVVNLARKILEDLSTDDRLRKVEASEDLKGAPIAHREEPHLACTQSHTVN